MFGNPFYNETLKRYVEAFGFLFKSITIERTNGTDIQRQVVPIQFSPSEKYLARNQVDPDIERPVAMQLPRLSYNLINIERDTSRQLNPLNKLVCFKEDGVTVHYVPVPYNLTFELSLRARHIEDMYKVTDQILPYFAPYFTIKAVVVEGMCPQNITFNLDAVNMSDQYEGPIDETRILVWTYIFTLKVNFFGPDMGSTDPTDPTKVIRWVRINQGAGENGYFDSSSNNYPIFDGKTLLEILPTDNYTIVTDELET